MTLAEVVDHGEIVPVRSGVVALAAPLEQIVQAQQQYHDVCLALLDDKDVQAIGDKTFKKRSAWNKLAVAFGVSTTLVSMTHERDERGRIVRTEVVARAEAPNGRVSDGVGACDLYERCCDPDTCTKRTHWEDTGRPTGHVHCDTYPCRQAHFSNPQHDIPATAFTRASNRAKADLFGMGEVSAEEVSEGGANFNDEGGAKSDSGGRDLGPMQRRARKLIEKLNLAEADALQSAVGRAGAVDSLDFAELRKLNDWLTEQEKKAAQ